MNQPALPQVYFREDQRFRQAFLWVPLTLMTAVVSGTTVWMIARQIFRDLPFYEDGVGISNGMLLALGGVVLGLNACIVAYYVFAVMQLEVNDRGLFIRFFPWHRRTRQIDLTGVESLEVVEFRALLEYGGYGIRKFPTRTCYAVRGLEGVRINYENGIHIMLGSQHPEQLFQALTHYLEQRA